MTQRDLAVLAALLLWAAPARAADPLPIQVPSGVLATTATVLSYTVDLGTLPTRPLLLVEVTPDAAHSAMQLEIEATDFLGTEVGPGACPGPINSILSPSGPGVATLSVNLLACDPRPDAFDGDEVTIRVTAVNFDGAPAPATVSISIRGVTQVPTATLLQQVDTNPGRQVVSLTASKDTVLYSDAQDSSNGSGRFLWAGSEVFTTAPPLIFTIRRPRHSLLAFDFAGVVPPVAEVHDADLHLDVTGLVGGGGAFSVYRVADSALGSWSEGNANALGDEFDGAASVSAAADWLYRIRPDLAWTTAGGDDTGPLMASTTIAALGPRILSTSSLTNAVQDMVTTGDDDDGFILYGPGGALLNATAAIQLASSENFSEGDPPELVVTFTPAQPWESGTVQTGVMSFVSEGEDFRWIYDLDRDDIFVTDIGGICEVLAPEFVNYLPYTYTYAGTPGYTGVDCCTWQIDSPETGTLGTGQALFFHNLDAANPANLPPDADGDAIRDNCDNCPAVPNGPSLGSCIVGSPLGGACRSDPECGPGGRCSLGQEDSDGDFTGNVCELPEPGPGLGLAAGLALLGGLSRIRLPASAHRMAGDRRFARDGRVARRPSEPGAGRS